MRIESFNSGVEFSDERASTKVLMETSFSKEIRILLKSGQSIKEHRTPSPILIHILEGRIDLGTEGEKIPMKSGDIVALEGNIPHDLVASENSIIRLTLSKADKAERLKNL